MIISGLQKTSLLDYPEKISTIVFTNGCNFRCGYCHNPELLTPFAREVLSIPAFFEFLKTRIGKIDAVVITGGEPCLQTGLKEFILEIKNLGFLVKLDTNGSFPDILKELIAYTDYIAMDIKAPFEKYSEITCSNIDIEKIKKSINLIMNSEVDYEFRTTVVKSQLCIDDLVEISEIIKGAKKYYLQKFIPSKPLNQKFVSETTYTDTEFENIIVKINNNLEFTGLRG